jgi:hypothetical protein
MLVGGATIIIIFAIVITAAVQGESETFSQVQTFGPVWNNPTWTCTSDKDYMIHGVLRGLSGAQLRITISGHGSQGLYDFSPVGSIKTFSVGANGGDSITLIREGTVTGRRRFNNINQRRYSNWLVNTSDNVWWYG